MNKKELVTAIVKNSTTIAIAASRTPTFKAGKDLKDKIKNSTHE
jgi:nucleoid DNA-binding protein